MGVDDPRAPSGPALEPTALAPISGGAPATFLHYRVLGKFGEGGVGAVFKAEDQRLGRVVAIKRLSSGAEDEAGRRRLVREARAASAPSHPNIGSRCAEEHCWADRCTSAIRLVDAKLAELDAPPLREQPASFGAAAGPRRRSLEASIARELQAVLRIDEPPLDLDATFERFNGLWGLS